MIESADRHLLNTPTAKLLRIYQQAGFRIQTGLNSYHFRNWRDAPFTLLFKDGKLVETGGGGISLHEIPFLEHLSLCADFQSILVIGNSFGWSTLLMGLLWPKARIVALDCGFLPPRHWLQKLLESSARWISGSPDNAPIEPEFGINLTNRLAQEHRLDVHVIQGFSPRDVSRTVAENMIRPPDFVFIDGYHTPDQVLLDYEAAAKEAAPDCVYLFHDVINWELTESFNIIQQRSGLQGAVLWRTMSGLGLLFPSERSDAIRELMEIFNEPTDTLRELRLQLPRRMLADHFKKAVLHSHFLHWIKSMLVRTEKKD